MGNPNRKTFAHFEAVRFTLFGATGSDVTTYTYDALDRLITAQVPGSSAAACTYDPTGQRVRQTVGSDTTNYLWDEFSAYGDVVRETNGTGTELASYTLAGSQILSQTRSGVTSYYLSDGQGSTRALLNGTGDLTDTYAYTAFGEIYNQTGSTLNNYLYTGQQFDSLTGLYSLRARYYDPGVGRFLSRDTYPINYQSPIELNRYGYATNNPINYDDPTGYTAGLELAQIEGEQTKKASIYLPAISRAFKIQEYRRIIVVTLWLALLIADFLAPFGIEVIFTPNTSSPETNPQPQPKPTPQPDPTGTETPPIPTPGTPPIPTPGTPPSEESDPTPEPEPEPDPDPTDPPQTDECDPTVDPDCARRRATTIVELGAGDYSNAIAMKAANSSAAVWATNLRSDWQIGKGFHQGGLSSSDYPIIKMYLGWQEAQVRGLQVGDTSSLENADVRPDHIGDLVYTIMPYPATAGQFGRDAARIASTKPGTTVAVTGGASGSANAFVQGFQAVRPGSVFVDVLGSPFGNPGIGWDNRSWEAGPYITKIHVVP